MRSGILPCYIDPEEVRQVKALARIEAERSGDDPDRAAVVAESRLLSRERTNRSRFVPFSCLPAGHGSPAWLPEARRVVGLAPARRLTEGRRRTFLRNQMVLALDIAGFSERQIAEAWGLSRARIRRIRDQMRALVT